MMGNYNVLITPLLLVLTLTKGLAVSNVYYLHQTTMGVTWEEGRDLCLSRGMDLAVINDESIMNEVEDYLATVIRFHKDFWIGLKWNLTATGFLWINYEPLSWIPPWYYDEPNCMELWSVLCSGGALPNDQNCIRLSVTVTDMFQWKTYTCSAPYDVLCQNISSSNEDTTYLQTSPSESYLQTSASDYYLQTSSGMATATPTDSTTQTSEPLTTKAKTTQSTLNGTSSIQTSIHMSTMGQSAVDVCPSCKCNVTTDVYWDSYNDTQLVLYKVDKHETSTYKRLHGCATDDRVSAKVMGYIGYIVIFSVFFVIVLIDLSRFQKMKLVKRIRKIIKKKSVSCPFK